MRENLQHVKEAASEAGWNLGRVLRDAAIVVVVWVLLSYLIKVFF